jgi:hypothetical protein
MPNMTVNAAKTTVNDFGTACYPPGDDYSNRCFSCSNHGLIYQALMYASSIVVFCSVHLVTLQQEIVASQNCSKP